MIMHPYKGEKSPDIQKAKERAKLSNYHMQALTIRDPTLLTPLIITQILRMRNAQRHIG